MVVQFLHMVAERSQHFLKATTAEATTAVQGTKTVCYMVAERSKNLVKVLLQKPVAGCQLG
jgi:hypothetical protein